MSIKFTLLSFEVKSPPRASTLASGIVPREDGPSILQMAVSVAYRLAMALLA